MFKVGDKIRNVSDECMDLTIGNIYEVFRAVDGCLIFYDDAKDLRYRRAENYELVKPQTEAERRGAKFGIGGILKHTGERLIFISGDSSAWRVIKEGSLDTQVFMSFDIRLDHEPEYKEIPFSEATHEQRMDVGNLIIDGGEGVSEIMKFDMAGYAYTLRGKTEIYTDTTILTIRFPS